MNDFGEQKGLLIFFSVTVICAVMRWNCRQSNPLEGLEGTQKFSNKKIKKIKKYCIAVVPSLLQTISMCVMNDMTSLCGMLSYV